ncbi:unnamed protein product, partial [Chrysoparadoxa australica]
MNFSGAPTFDDLSIDDNLTQLERVVKYSSSGIALQRLVHVKMLAETASAVGYEESVRSIMPLLRSLSHDQEYVVRQHLGEQLDEISKTCHSSVGEGGYRLILEVILPTLARLVGDTQAEVRQTAGEALVCVAQHLKPSDLGQYVLTIVLQLAHDDDHEELRMTAAQLLNELAECLGEDLCKQFVVPEMVSLSADPAFRVRKATALSLHNVCRIVTGAGRTDRLFPAYIRLTKDDMYKVRKACTESLVEISKAVGSAVGVEQLTAVFLSLASDPSKVVRQGALQHLGPFISTLPGEKVSKQLLEYFVGAAMAPRLTLAGGAGDSHTPGQQQEPEEVSTEESDLRADAELRLYSAFSFPAVVVTVGPSRWGEVKEAFQHLARDREWNVRKTLAHSLHELAKVLTPDQVEEDILPEVQPFLHDTEEVRIGIVRCLAEMLAQLRPKSREEQLETLSDMLKSTNGFNWRLRELLADQLPGLCDLFPPMTVSATIVPLAFTLLVDPVSAVREKAFLSVGSLIRAVNGESGGSERQASVIGRVREFAHAGSYALRQMYISICSCLATSTCVPREQVFLAEFLPSLADLARDPVVNVRITLSRMLSQCPEWLMLQSELKLAAQLLATDTSVDVRHFMSFWPAETHIEEVRAWEKVETSSCVSDESTRTAWSVNTQRSEITVSDFSERAAMSDGAARDRRLGSAASSSSSPVRTLPPRSSLGSIPALAVNEMRGANAAVRGLESAMHGLGLGLGSTAVPAVLMSDSVDAALTLSAVAEADAEEGNLQSREGPDEHVISLLPTQGLPHSPSAAPVPVAATNGRQAAGEHPIAPSAMDGGAALLNISQGEANASETTAAPGPDVPEQETEP